MLEISNFRRVPNIDVNTEQHGRQTRKLQSLGYLTTVMLMKVCNYFLGNLLCRTTGFVDDKWSFKVKV
jgi:hypothetical protein